ncbi:MAG TPA: PAS domain S-box protein [Phycisphaerae bacterium]|nr:PAS domain S-box protein [Phycisphaerae bacterium]
MGIQQPPDTAPFPASQAHLQLIADTAPVLMWIADESKARTWFNRPWLSFVGRSLEEEKGQGWTHSVHPDDLTRYLSVFESGFDERRPFKIEYRQRKHDGEFRWVLAQGTPLFDSNGVFTGFVGCCTDIHDKKETEHELRRSVERTESLYQLGKSLAGETDSHKLVQLITDTATKFTGAAFGAFFYNMVSEDGEALILYTLSGAPREAFANFPIPRNTAVFAPSFRGEGILRSDDITKDPRYGKSEPFLGMPPSHLPVRSYMGIPVISRSGKVIGVMLFGHPDAGVFKEEAERIAAAIAGQASIALDNASLIRQVQESEAKFRQLANTIPQLAWMARPDGWIFWYNDRWYEFTGTTAEQMQGWRWEAVHDPMILPQVLERWRACLHEGVNFEMEFPLRGADGRFRWFLTRVAPLRDESERIIFWFGTNTDITDRQEVLEAERAAREELERTGRMKDEFLATLSHELRTPLNAIVGWVDLLRRRPADQAVMAEGLAVIDRNARVQTQLISDLLDMSRIISGKVRLDMQRVELPSVIESAIESVRPTADAKGVRIRVLLDAVAGPVTGDPARLQQIFWNLLTNAVKFTPKNGKIEVLLERINSHLEISVADTGVGIRPEFLPYIFERFTQADSSVTRRHGGLGIGLAIVKHLVELHNGSVRAKSAGEGEGATFIVALPLRVRKDEELDRYHPATSVKTVDVLPPDTSPVLRGISVLVVDDEPDAREVMRKLLEECEATVTAVSSGQEALDYLENNRPHVVLSDIGMPVQDGFDFLREVRRRGLKSPAIAVTAFARSEDRLKALRCGYQMHLAKPLEPAELIAAVASLAGRLSNP